MGAARRGARSRSNPQPYRCFLVRCRLEAGAGPLGEASGSLANASVAGAWRFTVQQADSDATRRCFASIKDVAAYLEAELAAAAFAEAKPEEMLPNRRKE